MHLRQFFFLQKFMGEIKKKFLLVGPIMPPVHGQSLAFTRFVESFEKKNFFLINTNQSYKNQKLFKIFNGFIVLFLILFRVLLNRIYIVYFTCSRSFFGSIKDVMLINIANLRGVRIINHLHGSDFYDFLHNSPKWYQKILFKSYEKVETSIVLLDRMKQEFRDFDKMKVKVVPNFYDNELDSKLASKSKDNIYLVYLSNITTSKGIFELISAFNRLSPKYPNLILNIAGEFISDELMSFQNVKKKFYKKIFSNDKIKYLGNIYGENKIKLLQSSDIFVLPSYYKSEAFPISIIEAMSCGNVIITSNYKYLPDVINFKNGSIVEPRSIKNLVDEIEDFINNLKKLRQIQKYNIVTAKEKYSFDRYLKNMQKIVIEK